MKSYLTTAALRQRQAMFRRAAIVRDGDLFGIGGDTWQVYRAAGDGFSAPGAPALLGTITAYVREDTPGRGQTVVVTDTQQVEERQSWHCIIVTDPVGVRAGDVLVSTADTTLSATLVDPVTNDTHVRWRVDLVEGYQ